MILANFMLSEFLNFQNDVRRSKYMKGWKVRSFFLFFLSNKARQCAIFSGIFSSLGKQTYRHSSKWSCPITQPPSQGCFSPLKLWCHFLLVVFLLISLRLVVVFVGLFAWWRGNSSKICTSVCLVWLKMTFILNLLCVLLFFQNVSSQFCFSFFLFIYMSDDLQSNVRHSQSYTGAEPSIVAAVPGWPSVNAVSCAQSEHSLEILTCVNGPRIECLQPIVFAPKICPGAPFHASPENETTSPALSVVFLQRRLPKGDLHGWLGIRDLITN